MVRALIVALFLVGLSPSAMAAPEVLDCKGALAPSVEGGCDGVTYTGCCDVTGRLLWCDKGDLYCLDCADGFDACGWNDFGYYDCGQVAGSVSPSPDEPASCAGCPAECSGGAACSPICAGLCGACLPGETCLESGACYAPQCGDKDCGTDPLGFDCGQCGAGTTCVEGIWQCLDVPAQCLPKAAPGCDGCACEACVCELFPTCCTEGWDLFCASACELACGASCDPCPPSPSCDGIPCGSYCGVDCGGCPLGQICLDFSCCAPDCEGKSCGSDGCGGDCGACTSDDICQDGQCVPCPASCDGKTCGDDGCGGSCGTCPEDSYCVGGQCSISACDGRCEAGEVSCGEACTCSCNASCFEFGDCCPSICDVCGGAFPDNCCAPDCVGKTCGDDGCGGSCGGCPPGQICDGAFQICIDCAPDCFQKTCGDDGCGGSCGDCAPGDQCDDQGQCGPCAAQCEGKVCGDDGCGSNCGLCGTSELCVDGACAPLLCTGRCGEESVEQPGGGTCSCSPFCLGEAACCEGFCESCGEDYAALCCVPQCQDMACGDDGCWGSCGSCKVSQSCIEGVCVTCQPDCLNKGCGADGCGGSCGECSPGFECEGGYCVVCEPDCAGKGCGDDGCGGSCGECTPGTRCEGFTCVDCEPACDAVACGDDGCGGLCADIGEVPACQSDVLIWCEAGQILRIDCAQYDQSCVLHELEGYRCLPVESCEAACEDKECGSNGCGGYCGSCQPGQLCQDGVCGSVGQVGEDVEEPQGWVQIDAGPTEEPPPTSKPSSGCSAPPADRWAWPLALLLGLVTWRLRRRGPPRARS